MQGTILKGVGMLEVLEIDDPYQRLMYAVIYQAFLDFYYYPHKLDIRLPAFRFLVSGGGEYKEYTKMNIKRVFIKYCKEEYWDEGQDN